MLSRDFDFLSVDYFLRKKTSYFLHFATGLSEHCVDQPWEGYFLIGKQRLGDYDCLDHPYNVVVQ